MLANHVSSSVRVVLLNPLRIGMCVEIAQVQSCSRATFLYLGWLKEANVRLKNFSLCCLACIAKWFINNDSCWPLPLGSEEWAASCSPLPFWSAGIQVPPSFPSGTGPYSEYKTQKKMRSQFVQDSCCVLGFKFL